MAKLSINELLYNLRGVALISNKPNTVAYGLETISYRCQEVWSSISAILAHAEYANHYRIGRLYGLNNRKTTVD